MHIRTVSAPNSPQQKIKDQYFILNSHDLSLIRVRTTKTKKIEKEQSRGQA